MITARTLAKALRQFQSESGVKVAKIHITKHQYYALLADPDPSFNATSLQCCSKKFYGVPVIVGNRFAIEGDA